jgi:glyoxylase-like metal-dependent hydrolase (beta-lactamase superfamily II)
MSEKSATLPPGITVTGTIQQQAWRDRVLPPVEQVRPGLWSVPTLFPDSPLRYVLSYLIETSAGLVLVDTGWPSDEAWDALVGGVRQTGHELADVETVLVTHYHGDHFGLAAKVRELSGARVAMHSLDAKIIQGFGSLHDFSDRDRDWLRRRGVPASQQAEMLPPVGEDHLMGEHATVDILLEDGDRPLGTGTPLRVIWTPGHTPGHICIAHEEHDVLLTGDHVLPRISPNISPLPGVEDDTLGEYLDSLAALGDLDVSEVLPAHEYRFSGLPARVRALREHHADRLAEIIRALAAADGLTTLEVAEQLTWSRPWAQNRGMIRRSAIGETYAHLVHLKRLGQITVGSGKVDAWKLDQPANLPKA